MPAADDEPSGEGGRADRHPRPPLGGRVHFGIGKGGTQQEAGTFGYQKADAAEMVDEMMYLVPRIMAEDSLAHDGKWVQFEERSIHPKPMQDPHPPMYLACTGTSRSPSPGVAGSVPSPSASVASTRSPARTASTAMLERP